MTISNSLQFSDASRYTPAESEGEEGAACVPNISPKERQLRKRFAIQQFVFTLVVLGVLVALDVNPLWRLPLFFLFSAATTSYFQALDKT
jgi:hypothetical protein